MSTPNVFAEAAAALKALKDENAMGGRRRKRGGMPARRDSRARQQLEEAAEAAARKAAAESDDNPGKKAAGHAAAASTYAALAIVRTAENASTSLLDSIISALPKIGPAVAMTVTAAVAAIATAPGGPAPQAQPLLDNENLTATTVVQTWVALYAVNWAVDNAEALADSATAVGKIVDAAVAAVIPTSALQAALRMLKGGEDEPAVEAISENAAEAAAAAPAPAPSNAAAAPADEDRPPGTEGGRRRTRRHRRHRPSAPTRKGRRTSYGGRKHYTRPRRG